jgi:glyoxylase-like metal-dependent hydrolase (beta-lactamase superfamily II)
VVRAGTVAALGSAANQNFISNAAFVITPDGVLVIDALGSPPLAERLLAMIRERTSLPLRYVVVTHCHADHIYGLQVFKAAGARIVAHAGCRDYLNSDTARLRCRPAARRCSRGSTNARSWSRPTSGWVTTRRTRTWCCPWGSQRFRVRHAGPAHTREDLIVYMPSTGVFFAGDIVFRGRVPFVGQADSRRWITALDRLLALQPRACWPGHGPLSLRPAPTCPRRGTTWPTCASTMGEAARNLEPFDEAYARTDWSRFEAWPLFPWPTA